MTKTLFIISALIFLLGCTHKEKVCPEYSISKACSDSIAICTDAISYYDVLITRYALSLHYNDGYSPSEIDADYYMQLYKCKLEENKRNRDKYKEILNVIKSYE